MANTYANFIEEIWQSHPASDLNHYALRNLVWRAWMHYMDDMDPLREWWTTDAFYANLDRALYHSFPKFIALVEQSLEDEYYDWRTSNEN